jgi:putative membrane protein
MSVKQIALLAILVVFAVFVLQNTQVLEIRLLFWKVEASRALVLVITFALGIAAGFLLRMVPKKGKKAA